MNSDLGSAEVQGAIGRLRAGGRLFLVEEKPYPNPHRVIIVLYNERYPITYNDFVSLVTKHIIQLIGPAVFDTYPAEEYILSLDYGE